MFEFLENLWNLFVDMSFYIVIGLAFTGFLHAFIKKDTILKHIGKNNTSSVVKASIFGVPLPLCSCGVVPTAMYLGKSGASKGAVVSFLTSTPQTGVDSIIATYGMMGPLFAFFRAIAAFISGIISGIITNILCKNDNISCNEREHHCCSSQPKEEAHHCCCGSHEKKAEVHVGLFGKLKVAMAYGFGEFLDKIALRFVIGLVIASLITTLLPAEILSFFSENTFVSMLLMIAIGIPMYVCSTASIPITVSLILKGISPGAAFVFLFAGPLTNIASLTIVAKTLGKKVTAIYLVSASVCAVGFGLLLDFVIDATNYNGISNLIAGEHCHEMPLYRIIIACLFGILLIKGIVVSLKNKKKC